MRHRDDRAMLRPNTTKGYLRLLELFSPFQLFLFKRWLAFVLVCNVILNSLGNSGDFVSQLSEESKTASRSILLRLNLFFISLTILLGRWIFNVSVWIESVPQLCILTSIHSLLIDVFLHKCLLLNHFFGRHWRSVSRIDKWVEN